MGAFVLLRETCSCASVTILDCIQNWWTSIPTKPNLPQELGNCRGKTLHLFMNNQCFDLKVGSGNKAMKGQIFMEAELAYGVLNNEPVSSKGNEGGLCKAGTEYFTVRRNLAKPAASSNK